VIELSEQNAAEYLRKAGRVSPVGEVLAQPLSGGIANIVLKIIDTAAGEKLGSDLRSASQVTTGAPDTRTAAGSAFVLKQPLPRFRTAAEWLVDIDRVLVERDCMILLDTLLPAGSVPKVLWFDAENHVLAISCAPTGSVIWKKALLAGETSNDAATQAGMLLAMMHSATDKDAEVKTRYGEPKFFIQQRIDPYLHATAAKHPAVGAQLKGIAKTLTEGQLCLVHGDYSPKNIFLVPEAQQGAALNAAVGKDAFIFKQLLLLDFEVAYYGHPAFDVATLINHFLLKAFYQGKNWQPFMLMADNFWQTYKHTADPMLVTAAEKFSGSVLGALMLARIDGKSPAEYLLGNEPLRSKVRETALDILKQPDGTIERALGVAGSHLGK
jgi:5-methylthioribose kinase